MRQGEHANKIAGINVQCLTAGRQRSAAAWARHHAVVPEDQLHKVATSEEDVEDAVLYADSQSLVFMRQPAGKRIVVANGNGGMEAMVQVGEVRLDSVLGFIGFAMDPSGVRRSFYVPMSTVISRDDKGAEAQALLEVIRGKGWRTNQDGSGLTEAERKRRFGERQHGIEACDAIDQLEAAVGTEEYEVTSRHLSRAQTGQLRDLHDVIMVCGDTVRGLGHAQVTLNQIEHNVSVPRELLKRVRERVTALQERMIRAGKAKDTVFRALRMAADDEVVFHLIRRAVDEYKESARASIRCQALAIQLGAQPDQRDGLDMMNAATQDHIAATSARTETAQLHDDHATVALQAVTHVEKLAHTEICGHYTIMLPTAASGADGSKVHEMNGIAIATRASPSYADMSVGEREAIARDCRLRKKRIGEHQGDALDAAHDRSAAVLHVEQQARREFIEKNGRIPGMTVAGMEQHCAVGWGREANETVRRTMLCDVPMDAEELRQAMQQEHKVDVQALRIVTISNRLVRESTPSGVQHKAAGTLADRGMGEQILVKTVVMTGSGMQFFATNHASMLWPAECTWEQFRGIKMMARCEGTLRAEEEFVYAHPSLGACPITREGDLRMALSTAVRFVKTPCLRIRLNSRTRACG